MTATLCQGNKSFIGPWNRRASSNAYGIPKILRLLLVPRARLEISRGDSAVPRRRFVPPLRGFHPRVNNFQETDGVRGFVQRARNRLSFKDSVIRGTRVLMKSSAYFWNLVHFFPFVRSLFWLFNNLTDIYIANSNLCSFPADSFNYRTNSKKDREAGGLSSFIKIVGRSIVVCGQTKCIKFSLVWYHEPKERIF